MTPGGAWRHHPDRRMRRRPRRSYGRPTAEPAPYAFTTSRPSRRIEAGMTAPTRILIVANRTSSTPMLLEEVSRRKDADVEFTLLIPPEKSAGDWSLDDARALLSRAAGRDVGHLDCGPDAFDTIHRAVDAGAATSHPEHAAGAPDAADPSRPAAPPRASRHPGAGDPARARRSPSGPHPGQHAERMELSASQSGELPGPTDAVPSQSTAGLVRSPDVLTPPELPTRPGLELA